MGKIAVIDTETVTGTYGLLSVGAVILERKGESVEPLESYFGFSDEYQYGFYFAQQSAYAKLNRIERKPRIKIESEVADLIRRYGVCTVFAYNARFDKAVARAYLPELQVMWYDLMKPARQVLASAEHYPMYKRMHPYAELTKNGLLKRGYSVECVGRYLGLPHETHVAIEDALMETEIAVKLGLFDCASACR